MQLLLFISPIKVLSLFILFTALQLLRALLI